MKKFLSTSILLLGFSFVFSYYYPHVSLSPGNVQKYHAKLEQSCLECHSPVFGATNEKCAKCHPLTKMSEEKQLSAQPDSSIHLSVRGFHEELGKASCAGCHMEHAAKMELPKPKFIHDSSNVTSNCNRCHAGPENSLHKSTTAQCSSCHTITTWKGARFSHSGNDRDCLSCHKNKTPADSLHRSVGDCAKCHNTRNWRAANFDHSKYFRFSGAHPSRCETCHQGGDYSRYSCFGCHEHSRAGVEREHRRICTGNSCENCARCHRSGSEREAWQNFRQFQNGGVDGTTGATTRGGYGEDDEGDEHKFRRSSREYEDDDDD